METQAEIDVESIKQFGIENAVSQEKYLKRLKQITRSKNLAELSESIERIKESCLTCKNKLWLNRNFSIEVPPRKTILTKEEEIKKVLSRSNINFRLEYMNYGHNLFDSRTWGQIGYVIVMRKRQEGISVDPRLDSLTSVTLQAECQRIAEQEIFNLDHDKIIKSGFSYYYEVSHGVICPFITFEQIVNFCNFYKISHSYILDASCSESSLEKLPDDTGYGGKSKHKKRKTNTKRK
jgi:hypothetical protein